MSTYKKGEYLDAGEITLLGSNSCPDCGNASMVEGPSGGGSQNFYCLAAVCGSKFNYEHSGNIQRISDRSPNATETKPYRPPVLEVSINSMVQSNTFRLYFRFIGAEDSRKGGPWWHRNFLTEDVRDRFLYDLRGFISAYAKTDGTEPTGEPHYVKPPRGSVIDV